MMGIHPGLSEDYISPHYLTRVTSELSAESQVFRFLDPNENRKGWFGGCGEFMCTGRKNVYVQDMDGKLLGATTSITSYNPEVGFKLPYCQHITEWNGFKCTGNKLAVLEFFNMGEDRQLVLDGKSPPHLALRPGHARQRPPPRRLRRRYKQRKGFEPQRAQTHTLGIC